MPGLLIQSGAGAGVVPAVSVTNQLAWWKLASTADSGPNSHTLTNSNAVTFGTALSYPANVAIFVLATNQALTVANTADLTMAGDRNFTGWFTTPAFGASQFLLAKDAITAGTREYNLAISSAGQLVWSIYNTSNAQNFVNGPTLTIGRRYFFSASYNATSKVMGLQVVERGNIAAVSTTTLTGTPRTATAENFAIGNATSNNRPFGGNIWNVRLYGAVLTSDAVNAMYWGGIGQ